MKFILLSLLIAYALAAPTQDVKVYPKPWGNPDEWGPYFEGDMKLVEGQPKNGILDDKYRWPNGQVIWEYTPGLSSHYKNTVKRMMEAYVSRTNGCISFKERTYESDYVYFTDDDNDGCHSWVGRIGGPQQINYPGWCINQYGSVEHEMYHALGFFHEQSRYDRNDYVTIEYQNIEPAAMGNFEICETSKCSTFNTQYDYGSVMHYSMYAFSKNGQPTIVPTDPNAEIGQRIELSENDIRKLVRMYNCPPVKEE